MKTTKELSNYLRKFRFDFCRGTKLHNSVCYHHYIWSSTRYDLGSRSFYITFRRGNKGEYSALDKSDKNDYSFITIELSKAECNKLVAGQFPTAGIIEQPDNISIYYEFYY